MIITCNLRRIYLSQQKGRCRRGIKECLPMCLVLVATVQFVYLSVKF